MLFFARRQPTDPQGVPSQAPGSDYARLITDHLPYIEKQCRRAASKGGATIGGGAEGCDVSLENEADELLNQVLDRLREDDFKALRDFKGSAKITTYLTTIVSNLVVDLVRQKKGRSRARERAQEMGAVAELLYDLVYSRGCSLHEAHSHLEISFGIREPLHNLQQMLERMRGRDRAELAPCAEGDNVWLVPGRQVLVDDVVEVVVADPRRNAEHLLIADQKQRKAQSAVAALLGELSGEERLMLQLRFPSEEDEEPKSVREIANLLGQSEKSVDARIRRILVRFRETLLGQGLALKDLIDA